MKAISRFRPASPSVRAGSRAKGSAAAPRGSTSSCRWRTTTSSSRFWPKSRATPARLAKDRLGAYLVGGIISGFSFQVIYNVAMSAGLAPVKGITLPLMSYGGSSLIAALASFGLIINVRMRRFTN